MILLTAASLLLFFITYFSGLAIASSLKKLTGTRFIHNFFDIFLLGLMGSFIYFNLVSFFVPVNYIVLFPLLLVATGIFLQRKQRQQFFRQCTSTGRLFFSGTNAFFTSALLVAFFVYWITPPANEDSGSYHYLSILWYEQYRVVPGLANVHGRFAFNPASFILSAPYCFTKPVAQSLYPLNGVLAITFYTWLLKKIISVKHTMSIFALLICGILLFRNTLSNIASPSSDLLVTLLVFYAGFRIYENLLQEKISTEDYFLIFLYIAFAITAKLSSVFILTAGIYIFCYRLQTSSKTMLVIKLLPAFLLLLMPWLARNVVLCGSLIYPLPHTNFFNVDWAAPQDLIKVDYIVSKYYPRIYNQAGLSAIQTESFFHWLFPWIKALFKNAPYSLLIFVAALLSPLWWIRRSGKNLPPPVITFFLINYFNVWLWLFSSPDARFGLPFHVLAIGLPLMHLYQRRLPAINTHTCGAVLIWIAAVAYSINAFSKKSTYPFTIADCWLKPLKDYRYNHANANTFPYTTLNNGVKLYLSDSTHDCLNVCLPCMSWKYGVIEMRGKKLENGFRNVKDEVKINFPFINSRR